MIQRLEPGGKLTWAQIVVGNSDRLVLSRRQGEHTREQG